MIRFFPTSGDKHGWAIDEDLRLIRESLRGAARESPLCRAEVVHAPFWMALAMHDPEVLGRRFVIAHADNPPFFYLTQPEFAAGQRMVDLWVARSNEAARQFSDLGLAAVHIPYAIDERKFFPIRDRAGIRRKLGIPESAYVIGNFHRDSEGFDLSRPKLQKAPETFVAILKLVRERGLTPHVLLSGPRRHWIRGELTRQQIPFTFVGRGEVSGDDFGVNILPREQLNELYNACDLYLVASRWEGGPQSAMEAAAARVKTLSFPVGVAADILAPDSVFDTPSQAADAIVHDAREGHLRSTLDVQRERLLSFHTAAAMSKGLRRLYEDLPAKLAAEKTRGKPGTSLFSDFSRELSWKYTRRKPRKLPAEIAVHHEAGHDSYLDEAIHNLVRVLGHLGVPTNRRADGVAITGHSAERSNFRILPAGGYDALFADNACRIALSVQDAVNFKSAGHKAPVVVCPLVFSSSGQQRGVFFARKDTQMVSLDVWRAMLDKCALVYPSGSALYYQAFHTGVPYGAARSQEEAVAIAAENKDILVSLARPPSQQNAEKFWGNLLSQ